MNQRDELLCIPEMELGGFICPVCLKVFMGKHWAKHTNYCPDCGQRIRISTNHFETLKLRAKELGYEDKQKCILYYSKIMPEGMKERVTSGIYEKRLADLLEEKKQIDGQMHISEFIS